MDLTSMNPTSAKLLPMEIARTRTPAPALRFFAARRLQARLQALWHSLICRAGIRRQHKSLAVRETVSLGDRRLVSVLQFERQRFLIASSPSSVTLLTQLPDESGNGLGSGNESGEKK